MKLHTIGYILDNLEIDNVAYCYKGDCKGMLIITDQIDGNRLKSIYTDGEVVDGFYFKIDESIPVEDKKQWLLFHELEEGELKKEVITNIAVLIGKSINKGYEFKVV